MLCSMIYIYVNISISADYVLVYILMVYIKAAVWFSEGRQQATRRSRSHEESESRVPGRRQREEGRGRKRVVGERKGSVTSSKEIWGTQKALAGGRKSACLSGREE